MIAQSPSHPNFRARSRERYKRVALTTMTSVIARGTSVATMVIAVPLTIHYLGVERYGMWMTITSSVMLMTFADLGIGNGLLNLISRSTGTEDRATVSEYISSAFFMLLLVATAFLVIFVALYRSIPWGRLFNVTSGVAVRESGPAVAIFFLCFCLALPLSIVQKIHMGFQEGFLNNIWLGVGNVLGLGSLLIAVRCHAGLTWLVLALTGAPLLATLMNSLVLFRSRPWLIPKWSESSMSRLWQLLQLGVCFLLVQSSLGVVSGADNFIVAHHLGSAAVTQYSVSMRMFSALPALLIMVFNPLWPAYGEAMARGDTQWARGALGRCLMLTFVTTILAGSLLIVLGPTLLKVWVHGEVHASYWLLAGMALWMVLSAGANAISVFLNGANLLRVQVYCAIAMCCTATLLKILFIGRFGLAWVIWSTNVAYLVFVWVPICLFIPRRMSAIGHIASQQTLEMSPAYD